MWLRDCYYYLLLLSGPFLRRRRWWRWPVCVDRGWRVRGGTTSGRCRDRGSAPAGRRTRTCCRSAPRDSADSSERAVSPPSTTSAFRLAQHVETHVSLHVVATVFSGTFHTSNTQHSYEEQHVAENVHAVFISTFNVQKNPFYARFYHGTALYCIHCLFPLFTCGIKYQPIYQSHSRLQSCSRECAHASQCGTFHTRDACQRHICVQPIRK